MRRKAGGCRRSQWCWTQAAAKTLPAGPTAGQVWRVTGLLTFVAYATGSMQGGIWMARPWSAVGKEVFDSVIYAVITAAVFGWLWPT